MINRVLKASVAGKTFEYPNIYMSFEINFKDDDKGNAGLIKFFNLAQSTIDELVRGEEITIEAGYEEDYGTLLAGVIVKTETNYEGVDKETTCYLGDATDRWLNATINKTWQAGTDAQVVAQDIADVLPLDLGRFDVEKDIEYTNGKTFSTTCRRALREIAKDLEAKLHVGKGNIYFLDPDKGEQEVVLINAESGLVNTPQKTQAEDDEEKWTVHTLLNHRLWADNIIKIESRTIEGNYRITEGRHIGDPSSNDFVTELEVVKYD